MSRFTQIQVRSFFFLLQAKLQTSFTPDIKNNFGHISKIIIEFSVHVSAWQGSFSLSIYSSGIKMYPDITFKIN